MTICPYRNSRPLRNTLGQTRSDVRKIVNDKLYELAPGFIEMSYETMDMTRLDAITNDLIDYMFENPTADLRTEIHNKLEDWFEHHAEGEDW